MAFWNIPVRQDPEMQGWTVDVRNELLRLGRLLGSPGDQGTTNNALATSSVAGEGFTRISPDVLVSGTIDQAWATLDVSASVPDGATEVLLWVHLELGNSSDFATISFAQDHTGSSPASDVIRAVSVQRIQSSGDTGDDSTELRVPITASKTFDYQVVGTVSGTDSAWEIELRGAYSPTS